MSKKPYLSIVATTRNDNHGGDLLKRTICFVKGIYHQAQKFNLSVELIIVEWNPPENQPLLKDVLPKPKRGNPTTLKFIIVPNKIHQQFKSSNVLPLHQMIAKNVGIRRSKGEFVLCTNIDILFSDNCFRILAERNLKKNYFYRTSRCDVPAKVMDIEEIDSQLAFCKKNIIKRLGHFPNNLKHVGFMPEIFFAFPNAIHLFDNLLKVLFIFSKKEKRNINFINFQASGDFTLMSREDWFRIRGYYELDMFPLHVDSMALIEAYAIGMNQKTFDNSSCTYHIYHQGGWESNYKEPEDFIHLMEKRPALDWHGIHSGGKKLIEQKRLYHFSHENWGLSNLKLAEFTFP